MTGRSARAKLVIDAAQQFFQDYLFTTKSNYTEFTNGAQKEAKRKSAEFDGIIARSKIAIANKEKVYEKTKDLILENPELKEHFNLDKHIKEIEEVKSDFAKATKSRANIKNSIPTFEEYLKLLETTPVVLGKIRDMQVMDALIRIFFSNFTITPVKDSFRKGSKVTYKLNEPYEGFVKNGDFVLGAGTETLTPDLFLGKEAL